MGFASTIVDIIILAALGFTMYHALRLSRQFTQMQADRKAFEQLITALNLASSKAELATKNLRDAAAESGDALQAKVNDARALAGELEIMVQAADSLANRLSGSAETARKAVRPQDPADAPAQTPRSKAEQELLDALKSRQKG